MGLVELGRHTGLSASFLSQLETGRVVPTLRNLARVAMVFTSPPAVKPRPLPVMTIAPTASSEPSRGSASRRPPNISGENAFSRSGRFSVGRDRVH